MRIGIVYGHISSNLGDVAINHGTAAMLQKVAPDAHVHVVLLNLPESRIPEAEAAFSGLESKSFTTLRIREKLAANISSDYTELAMATEYVLNPARFIADTGLTGCDVVLYNSGEQLFAYDDHGNHIELMWRLLPALAAKAAGMRFVVLPATMGPFESPSLEPMLRAFFTLSDDMAVRENVSAQMAAEFLGVDPPPVLLDPAFFAPVPKQEERDADPTLALVMRLEGFGLRVGTFYESSKHLASFGDKGLSKSLSCRFAVAAARSFADRVGGRTRLIVQTGMGDGDLTTAIAQALEAEGYGDRLEVVQPRSVSEYQVELGKADFVVASRYHACILGLLSSRPVMGVYFEEHGHKMPGLFQMLGIPEYSCNLSRRDPESAAESVVWLFLQTEKAFEGIPERLRARQKDTLRWVSEAMAGQSPVRSEDVVAASRDYIRGAGAICASAAPDAVSMLYREAARLKAEMNASRRELTIARAETSRLKSELAKERRKVQQITNSLPYQLGNALLRPVRRPGRFVIQLAYRVLRRSPAGLKRLLQGLTEKNRFLRSLAVYGAAADSPAAYSRSESQATGSTSGGKAGLQVPSDEPDLSEQANIFSAYLDRFKETALSVQDQPLVVISSTTKRIGEANRSNRCMVFATELAAAGVPVIYVYYRFKGAREFADYYGGYLLQMPNDLFHAFSGSISGWDHQGDRLFLCSIPDVHSVPEVGLFRYHGWKVLYEVRDDWEEFHKAGVGKWYDPAYERFLCKQADCVTAVSCTLRDKMISLGACPDRTFIVPNGLTRAFLEGSGPSFTRRRSGYRGDSTIGYFGHLTENWFNWKLLCKVASRRKDRRFEIVGFGAPKDLKTPSNVVLLGEKTHDEIIDIASRWSAAMIPFKNSRLAEGVDPIKIYEYLALGLPCVSCWMPQIEEYPLVFTYRDDSRFGKTLDEAISYAPSEDDWDRVQSFLEASTWDQRVKTTLSLAGVSLPGVEMDV